MDKEKLKIIEQALQIVQESLGTSPNLPLIASALSSEDEKEREERLTESKKDAQEVQEVQQVNKPEGGTPTLKGQGGGSEAPRSRATFPCRKHRSL